MSAPKIILTNVRKWSLSQLEDGRRKFERFVIKLWFCAKCCANFRHSSETQVAKFSSVSQQGISDIFSLVVVHGIGLHSVLAARGMSRYALPMSIRLEFALLLAG